MAAPPNSFIVDYCHNNELLISMNIEYFNEYITALKASDFVTIKNNHYKVKEIIMQHIEHDKGVTIQLVVNL